MSFREIGPEVFVWRQPGLDVNLTLIVGPRAALVVDTLSTPTQAREALAAVRAITATPLVVVNTHHHFDHCFGNAVFDPVAIHAHPETAARLGLLDPVEVHQEWAALHADLADLREVVVQVPDQLVRTQARVDLGGRVVELRHPGRGHTAGDLVVHLPDAKLLVAGDLIEESGPPQFEDAFPLAWPEAVAALLALDVTTYVPGHGDVCDREFVRAQHAELATLDWLIRDGHADGAPLDAVVGKAPYPFETASIAVARGYAELDGRT